MAVNSRLPILRANISSLPAAVSKYHRPEEFWSKGTEKQSYRARCRVSRRPP